MALNTVTTGNTVLASDINQIVNVLQRSSGQTEVGKYFQTYAATASSQFISLYIRTFSQNTTPVSVTIDASDALAANLNSPSTGHLTTFGFQLYTSSTGAGANSGFGGNWTVQY